MRISLEENILHARKEIIITQANSMVKLEKK